MKLQDKVAIVTGGGGGFGEGIAKLFAAEGAKVAILDLREDSASQVANALGNGAIAIRADVASVAETDLAVKKVLEAFGRLDILVNNAGTSHRNAALIDVSEDEFDRVLRVNVKSLYAMARACFPHMIERKGGAVVNVGSTAGMRPRPGLTWYNGTKGMVNTLSQSMAAELASHNIRVNAICPVMGTTGLLETFLGGPDTPENRQRVISSIPLGRLSQPLDVARAALFLASDDAEFITGALLPVDGGRII